MEYIFVSSQPDLQPAPVIIMLHMYEFIYRGMAIGFIKKLYRDELF